MSKKKSRLWIYFAVIVFSIMFVTASIMIGLAGLLYHFGHLRMENGTPLAPIAFLLFMSVMIGTAISFFVAKKILNPITKFSKAAAEVATGNFNIHLDEEERIEEIRDLTRNFNLMVRELSSIETLRSDFVVNVSHEFKTPIASIEGYAALLQEDGLSGKERYEYTQIIINSARQLATLSDNVLKLSKLENQELVFEKNAFRLDEQIRQAVLLLEPEWSKKELNLLIDLKKTVYCGSEQLLHLVWVNIIGNAVKFTPQGGSIEVHLYEERSSIITRISDTGCGMDDSVQRHIFDKFYQADTARKSDGNGLGLALVKRIVDLCGGKTTVQSKAGEGSTFTISLPK